MFCALGCSPVKHLYIFPSRIHEKKRRKSWLAFFDMEEPNIEYVFACDRHFSDLQTDSDGLRKAAVPDIPVICSAAVSPFRRKPKNWRKNVVVVTPRDPEFTIYRHETGIFPQNLFNISDTVQPAIKMPIIKSVSCSMSTQTETRLCGLVQISDIKEEYHLNCFYCCEVFVIEKWPEFVRHLKNKHFEEEEAFKVSNYLSHDHDYTSKNLSSTLLEKSPIKYNMMNSFLQIPVPQPVLLDPVILPPLLAKPQKYIAKSPEVALKNPGPMPPPLLAKPHKINDGGFNIPLADTLIKLLNETVLSPNFLNTEEDNILIIKNTGSTNIETSDFLTNLMNSETTSTPAFKKTNANVSSEDSVYSYNTRPIHTIKYGQQDIPSRRNSLSRILLPPLPKTKMAKLIRKRIAQRTLKNINIFENIYKTLKIRHKVVEPEKKVAKQISNSTPLSRCLRRTASEAVPKIPKTIEIVFEFTPKEIIESLLENLKNFPVLWEFHDKPFNKQYSKAIEELCKVINEKWSINITLFKMRRSINRILRFYRFMLPRESIDSFENYFDKCAMYLPFSVDLIPHARCAYCFICYKKDSDLRKHMKERHKSLKWPYKCQHCLERFRESDEYELHKLLPHYEEIFKCERCDKRFNRRYLYNKHVASHKRSTERRMETNNPVTTVTPVTPVNPIIPTEQHECNVCKRIFTSLSVLKCHAISHQTYKCDLCPKEFSFKYTLKTHLKKHRQERDFICEVCGKEFYRKSCLDNHMETHTGAKITCKICNLKLRKCSLSRHLRLVHVATEGDLQSTFRAKSYQYNKFRLPKSELKNKRRSYAAIHRNYKCRICKIPFLNLKMLKDHNKEVHSDVKRTPCQMCNIEFIHMQNLKRHYRDKHKLHPYQVFSLIAQKEDLSTVLALNVEEFANMSAVDYITYTNNSKANVSKLNDSQDDICFEQERLYSDKIQDEIMKAVENLDKQEIKVDDDNSMNEFFTDLLK